MSAALLDHLWQSSLFALGAWAVTSYLSRNSARLRFAIWLAASVKFLLPFSWLAALGGQLRLVAMPEGVPALAAIGQSKVGEMLVFPAAFAFSERGSDASWWGVFGLVWACGAVALLARWYGRWARIREILRSATPSAIAAPIPVRTSRAFREPGVVGIFRPVLLLPAEMDGRLTAQQFRAILGHELCHVRRRDNLTAAIHMLVEVLYWFFPPVWWIGARMFDERERACDEAVVRAGNDPRVYAEGILTVCRSYVASELPCVAGVSGANLKNRLEAIMKNANVRELSVGRKLVLGILAFSAVSLPVAIGLAVPAVTSAAAASQAGKIELLAGKRVKLSYQNVEVRSLLVALAKAAQVNMLVSDKVSGSVTIDLAEMPWDQALNTILGSQGLVKREKDGILFVEPA